MNYRDQIFDFYQKHNPEKLSEIDAILRSFVGREEALFAALRAKYEGGISSNSYGSSSGVKGATPVSGLSNMGGERTVREELQCLLREMKSVDLKKLLGELRGRAKVEGELLAHTVMFIQHFTTCASRFEELGASFVPPETAAKQDAVTQTRDYVGVTAERCDVAVQASVTTAAVVTQTSLSSSSGMPGDISYEDILNNGEESDLKRVHVPPTNTDVTASPEDAHASMLEAMNSRRAIGAVHRLEPCTYKKTAVIGTLLASGQLRSTDSISLQPGLYHENLYFEDSGEVELVAAFPGAMVIIKPLTELEPLIHAEGGRTRLRVSGIVLVENDLHGCETPALDPSAPCKPLVSVSCGAQVDFQGCHLYQGGCAVEAMGPSTMVHMHLCVLSSCTFAGMFLHHCAKAIVSQCKVKQCEAGIRIASRSSVHAEETVLEENTTDGIVGYEGVVGMLERCSILRNGGNGIFLGASSTFSVVDSTIELNGLYGIQRLQGSALYLRGSLVRDNALLPINDTVDTTCSTDR